MPSSLNWVTLTPSGSRLGALTFVMMVSLGWGIWLTEVTVSKVNTLSINLTKWSNTLRQKCVWPFCGIVAERLKRKLRNRPISKYTKFSKKLMFLTPWYAGLCVLIRGSGMLVFQELQWRTKWIIPKVIYVGWFICKDSHKYVQDISPFTWKSFRSFV